LLVAFKIIIRWFDKMFAGTTHSTANVCCQCHHQPAPLTFLNHCALVVTLPLPVACNATTVNPSTTAVAGNPIAFAHKIIAFV